MNIPFLIAFLTCIENEQWHICENHLFSREEPFFTIIGDNCQRSGCPLFEKGCQAGPCQLKYHTIKDTWRKFKQKKKELFKYIND